MSVGQDLRVGILGAGVMGSSLALFLARKGAHVTIFDEDSVPFNGASRWNEGKIHLGYLYAGDPSLGTARKILPGALRFKSIVEELVGRSIAEAFSYSDDVYLTHTDSVVDVEAMAAYLGKVSDLIRGHPDSKRYRAEISDNPVTRMSRAELESISSSPNIKAGFRIPERSVRTRWIGDRFIEALRAESRIELMLSARVIGVAESPASRWMVRLEDEKCGPFDILINALWHGRSAIDETLGMPKPGICSYRFRASLFLKSKREWDMPSAIITTGPFGDVKNYNKSEFYFSWYPAGLLIDSATPQRFAIAGQDEALKAQIVSRTLAGLHEYFPLTRQIAESATELVVEGGWVIAEGGGQLSDPLSSLHKRDRFGVSHKGTYLTIDTGKYSTAPWLAARLANELCGS